MQNRISHHEVKFAIRMLPDGTMQNGMAMRCEGHTYMLTWIHRTRALAIDTIQQWATDAGLDVIPLYGHFQNIEKASVAVANNIQIEGQSDAE